MKASTITKNKTQGGLSLVTIPLKVRALASKIILWAISFGCHPLQIVLQESMWRYPLALMYGLRLQPNQISLNNT